MASVKLTKNELKTQKDRLKQYERYLPTLQLKKQQLQTVIMQLQTDLEQKLEAREARIREIGAWVAVFSENTTFPEEKRIDTLLEPDTIVSGTDNVAGVIVPIFRELTFKDIEYDVREYPLWVDLALVRMRELSQLDAEIRTMQTRINLLNKELRSTSQRVNLFEKVKIPEAQENIRVIGIYLGDQQTSAVVRGKIAKKKRMEEGAE